MSKLDVRARVRRIRLRAALRRAARTGLLSRVDSVIYRHHLATARQNFVTHVVRKMFQRALLEYAGDPAAVTWE